MEIMNMIRLVGLVSDFQKTGMINFCWLLFLLLILFSVNASGRIYELLSLSLWNVNVF